MKTSIAVIILFFASSSQCAKILGIFPTPSISHQVGFHALIKDLAARGHELTILTTDLIKIDNSNVTQIDLHFAYETMTREFNFVDFKNSGTDDTELLNYFFPAMMTYLQEELDHPEVQKLIHQKEKFKFDLMIYEHLIYDPILAFSELYDIPVIGIVSLDAFKENHDLMGNEANPIVHPEIIFPFIQGQLTFYERWKCLKNYIKMKYIFEPKQTAAKEALVQRNFPGVTSSIAKLRERVNFLMTNTHPALGAIRPILPNTIQLGFMHIEPPKPLKDRDLKKFLDNSEHGVIYMSLGSNVKSEDLKPEVLNMFLNVFGSVKYDILWKFEAEHLPNKPKNVMIQKWLPQADLLAHPKIKLFITQGGQQSMEETIDRGVPTIVIPFLGDQQGNAKRMEKLKFGKKLEIDTLTENQLKSAIIEMLKSEYKENVIKLRELVHDQPMTSREKAVWWAEYVIRQKGAKHLAYSGKEIPTYQKYFLDFVAIAIGAVTSLAVFILIVIRKLSRQPPSRKSKSN